jgi:hypothetical protein
MYDLVQKMAESTHGRKYKDAILATAVTLAILALSSINVIPGSAVFSAKNRAVEEFFSTFGAKRVADIKQSKKKSLRGKLRAE